MEPDTFHWLDVERIAEELAEQRPDADPLRLSFPELKALVKTLPGFKERAEHPVNERILETIQALWRQELDELPQEDDEA